MFHLLSRMRGCSDINHFVKRNLAVNRKSNLKVLFDTVDKSLLNIYKNDFSICALCQIFSKDNILRNISSAVMYYHIWPAALHVIRYVSL